MNLQRFKDGSFWPVVAMLVVAVVGSVASLFFGMEINRFEERRWRARAEYDAMRLTHAMQGALGQAESQLRAIATLFYASEDVTGEEFRIAGEIAAGAGSGVKFRCLIYVAPPPPSWTVDDRMPPTLSSCPTAPPTGLGDILPGGHDLRQATALALAAPTTAVVSPALEHDGRWWALFAITVPDQGGRGVLAGLVEPRALFSSALTATPPGLILRSVQPETDRAGGIEVPPILFSDLPDVPASNVLQFGFTHAQTRWLARWSLLPGYAGDEIQNSGDWAMLGGSILSLMIALLVGRLLLQNVEVRRRVRERTSELARTRDEAELANRSKTEFLATMSHELRTPLNAIIGFSEIMRDEALGPIGQEHYREYANDIHDSGAHLLELINDILDIAKAEAGKIELLEEPVNLERLIPACFRLIDGRAREQGLTAVCDLPAALPPLYADLRRLRQIVINLLSNAIKFTPEGGHVRIGAERRDDGTLRIYVADSGIGMSAEEIPIALAPFRQIDSTLHRKYEGTGLGLPLCKRLAELHGGVLNIDSARGRGTTVEVIFPAERVFLVDEASRRRRA